MATPVQSTIRARYESLDTLRYLAAGAVLIAHAQAMHPWLMMERVFESGLLHPKSAVAFFFVLSGFVLHLSWKGALPTWRTFGVFIVRRWFRIYPLYFVSLLLAFSVVTLLPLTECPFFTSDEAGSEVLLRDRGDAMQWLHHFLLITPGLDMQFLNPPIWTLAVEMRVAFVFPWVSHACAWLSPRSGILVLVLSFITAPWIAERTLPTLAVVPLFALGALAAQYRERFTRMSGIAAWTMLIAGVMVYSLSASLRGQNFILQTVHMDVAALGSILIMLAVLRLPALKFLLEHRLLVFSGQASYGLYVLHFPLIMGLAYFAWRTALPAWAFMMLGLVFSTTLAGALYRLIELPSIRAGRDLGGRLFNPRRET